MTIDETIDERQADENRKDSKRNNLLAGKLVVLKFDGDFHQGFRVLLEIGPDGDRPHIELAGALPPNLEIVSHFSQWQQHYRSLSASSLANSRIQPQKIIYAGSVNRLEDCWQSAMKLHQQMTTWLESPSFRHLDLRLRESLSIHEPIRVLIRTQDPLLRRLPWHLWDFVERYAKTEIALSAPISERVAVDPKAVSNRSVKILAVLGNSQDINVQADGDFLAALPYAEVTFLVEPSRKEINDRLWAQPWDILFFAGHSVTADDRGLIYLNPYESLSLEELKYGLKQAISRGLQLAIFNSCDGLGLAQSLESLHLPQMIVMREPVPDQVAQAFLKYFLAAFSGGKSLYLAVREAREQLQSLEDQFPCATWLPMLCQNSAKSPTTWQALVEGKTAERDLLNPAASASDATGHITRSPTAWKLRPASQRQIAHLQRFFRLFLRRLRKGWIVLWVSLAVTLALTSPVSQRWVQPQELAAYDRMMQQRPSEGTDPRLLIIEITDADIEAQANNGELLKRRSLSAGSYNQVFDTSLSDQSLNRLLSALAPYQPRVIGLDIYRDFAAAPDQTALLSRLRNMSELVAVCKAEDTDDPEMESASIDPPPEVPQSRVGFSDFREDSDGILRRHLLGMLPLLRSQDSLCNTDWAFSLQIAAQYLSQQQVKTQFTEVGNLQFNQQTIEILRSRGSHYPPNAGGSEILLNYRATPEVAARLTLQQFLSQQPNPDYLEDKIVLIGVTAKGGEDYWLTPIAPNVETPGVIIQAHMISQLLSAALDERPILTTLSSLQRLGWLGTWATVGGFLSFWHCFWRSYPKRSGQSLARLAISLAAANMALYALCFIGLLRGHWLPVVSLTLALLLSSALVTVYLFYQSRIYQSQNRPNSLPE